MDPQRLAVEVLAAQGHDLAEPHAGISEDADHRLVAPCRLREAVQVAGADADALEGVEVGHFVGDRVLSHRREGRGLRRWVAQEEASFLGFVGWHEGV